MSKSDAGKGDRPRPVDSEKYRENYDKIFNKKAEDEEHGSKKRSKTTGP